MSLLPRHVHNTMVEKWDLGIINLILATDQMDRN